MPLTLVDYPVARQQSVAQQNDTTGLSYVLAFGAVPIGYLWKIDLLSVAVFDAEQTGFDAPSVLVYDQPIEPTTAPVTGTTLGFYESATTFGGYAFYADYDDDASITIRGGDQLLVAFDTDIPAGAVLSARAQYGLYQGTAGDPTPVAGAQAAPKLPVSL